MRDHGGLLPVDGEQCGGARGGPRQANNSMTIMRPPQHGHGGRKSSGSSGVSSGGGATFSSLRVAWHLIVRMCAFRSGHLEHRGSSTLDDRDACQQSRPNGKRQDRARRGGEEYLSLSDNVVQLRKDVAENPEALRARVRGDCFGQAPHQEEPSDIGWRCPCSKAVRRLVVDELLAVRLM